MIPEMTVNGMNIKKFNARLLSYSVGGTVMTHSTSASGNILQLNRIYHTVLSPRSLSVTLTFFPVTADRGSRNTTIPERLARSTQNIVRFESELIGRIVELGFPDGYYYTACLTAIQPPAFDATGEQDVVYTFLAIRHEPQRKETVTSGNKLNCRSNTKTPCKISFTLTSAQNSITVCGVTINSVAANTEIVIDSVNGLITAGGINKFNDTAFVDFPYLLPGDNTISCSVAGVTLTVIYTPIFA